MTKKKTNKWKVRFEVTFYGDDQLKGSFREIKEGSLLFGEQFEIQNSVPFDTKENVEINFMLWVDNFPISKLVRLPHDYFDKNVKYGEESIEVLEIIKL